MYVKSYNPKQFNYLNSLCVICRFDEHQNTRTTTDTYDNWGEPKKAYPKNQREISAKECKPTTDRVPVNIDWKLGTSGWCVPSAGVPASKGCRASSATTESTWTVRSTLSTSWARSWPLTSDPGEICTYAATNTDEADGFFSGGGCIQVIGAASVTGKWVGIKGIRAPHRCLITPWSYGRFRWSDLRSSRRGRLGLITVYIGLMLARIYFQVNSFEAFFNMWP